jgi:hypothetical protein
MHHNGSADKASRFTGLPVKATKAFSRYSFYPPVGGCAEGTTNKAYCRSIGGNRTKGSRETALCPCLRHFRQLVYICTFYYNKMKQFTERYVIMISENQHKTLIKLKQKYRINPAYFIRSAIQEKLQRENLELKERITKKDCPF